MAVSRPLFERMRETALLKWHLEPEDKTDLDQDQFAKDVTKISELDKSAAVNTVFGARRQTRREKQETKASLAAAEKALERHARYA